MRYFQFSSHPQKKLTKSLSLALTFNFLSLKIERQLFVSIFEDADGTKLKIPSKITPPLPILKS